MESTSLVNAHQSLTLTSVKENRRKIEYDRQLLTNRIQLLKLEEEKALKKIEDTKRRTERILELKKRNEEKQKQKAKLNEEKRREIDSLKERNAKLRDKNKAAKNMNVSHIEKSRRHAAEHLKNESKQLDSIRTHRLEYTSQQNAIKTQALRNKLGQANKIKQEDMHVRAERARCEYQKRVEEELQLCSEKEADIAKLEQAELELIERLQAAQLQQRLVYESLQASLSPTAGCKQLSSVSPRLALTND